MFSINLHRDDCLTNQQKFNGDCRLDERKTKYGKGKGLVFNGGDI